MRSALHRPWHRGPRIAVVQSVVPEFLHGTAVVVLQRCLGLEEGFVFAIAIRRGAGSIIRVAETRPGVMTWSRRAVASLETVACS